MQITKISQLKTNDSKQVHFGEIEGEPYRSWKNNEYNKILKDFSSTRSYYETQYRYWGMSRKRYLKGIETADACCDCRLKNLNNFDDNGHKIVKNIEETTNKIVNTPKDLRSQFAKLLKLVQRRLIKK